MVRLKGVTGGIIVMMKVFQFLMVRLKENDYRYMYLITKKFQFLMVRLKDKEIALIDLEKYFNFNSLWCD